jgi:hypothetical protein
MDQANGSSEPLQVHHLDSGHDMPVQPLSKFTLFPNLPLELRQKIWRATFSNLNQRTSRFIITDDPRRSQKPDFTPPITSQVNRESRLETLRCFHILETNDHGWCDSKTHSWARKCDRHIIFWNPDTCIFSANYVELRHSFLSTYSWKAHFAPSSSWESFAGLLRIIEMEIPCLPLRNRVMNERDFWYHAPSSTLSAVTGLLELRIVECPDSRKTEERKMLRDEGQEYVDLLTEYFEGRVAKGEILKMPKITLIITGDDSQ